MRIKRIRVIVLAIIATVGIINLLASSSSVTLYAGIVSSIQLPFSTNLKKTYTIPKPLVSGSPSLASPLVIVVCEAPGSRNETSANATDQNAYLRNSWTRQAEQLTTMLTTLLYFSKSAVWRTVVLTDKDATFNKIINLTTTLPDNRLLLEHQRIWFPREYPELWHHWRPCVWAKQFLAEILPNEDAVVYIDTDVVFLGPGEELWWAFRAMGPHQALALASEPHYQRDRLKRPFAGRVGLNTGVMVANLTRLRSLRGGGLGSAILREGDFEPPPRHDQDALNHFLNRRPHLLFEISSRWNFMVSACYNDAPTCTECFSDGISILHGADATFRRNIDRKFLVVYYSLAGLKLYADPRALLSILSSRLASVEYLHQDYVCANITHLNHALTLRLRDAATIKAAKQLI